MNGKFSSDEHLHFGCHSICSSDELEVRKCDNFLSTGGNRICQENSTKPQVLLTSNSPTRGNITINSEKQASPGIESMPVLKYSAPDTGPDGAPSGNFTLIVRASSLSSLIPLFGPATAEDPEQVETAPTLVNNSTLTPDFLENATNVTTMMDEQTLNPTPFHSPTRAPVRTDDAFTFNDDFEAFVMPEKKLTNLSDAGYIDARAEDPLVTGSVRNETLPSIPVAGSSPFNITSEIWPAFNSSVEHFAPSGSFLDNQTTANATGSVLNTTNEERTDVDIDDHSVALNVSPPSNSSTTMPAMHGIGKDDHPATPDLLGESDFTSNHSDPIEAQGGADEVHPLMPDDKVWVFLSRPCPPPRHQVSMRHLCLILCRFILLRAS